MGKGLMLMLVLTFTFIPIYFIYFNEYLIKVVLTISMYYIDSYFRNLK